jgi:hypothetical protein
VKLLFKFFFLLIFHINYHLASNFTESWKGKFFMCTQRVWLNSLEKGTWYLFHLHVDLFLNFNMVLKYYYYFLNRFLTIYSWNYYVIDMKIIIMLNYSWEFD